MRRSRIRNALIVLAAAAVLAPVVVYGWRHAGDLSKQRACVRNLQVLGQACKMYQEDWHDVLVPYGVPFAWPPRGKMWTDLLHPYLKEILVRPGEPDRTGKVFECPGYAEERVCYARDYGINRQCGGWMPDKKPIVVPLKSVEYPRSTIMIAETNWYSQGGSFWAAKPSEFTPGDPYSHMFATWHQGKGNVLWIDGHVSSMTQEQYNMRDKGPYDGNIWLRLEGPKPPVPGRRM